jgi:hypothetical protein
VKISWFADAGLDYPRGFFRQGAVLLFKRILNFKRDFLAKLRDKRKSTRFPVGQLFPLKATVNLVGPDAVGSTPGTGYDWGGRLINVSSNGAGLQLLRAATTYRGEKTELKLTLEDHGLAIPCEVAHFRTFSGYSLCGLSLQFTDFNAQKAYLQLVEAVSIGASFTPPKGKGGGGGRPGLVRDQFRAGSKATLNVWRVAKTGQLDGFEMLVGDHSLKGGPNSPVLEVYRVGKPPKLEGSAEVAGEVRRLFRWIVPNLPPKLVPSEVRHLMERLASSKGAVAGGSGSVLRASAPPTEWQPPAAKRAARG